MKKLVCVLLVCLLISAVFAGCKEERKAGDPYPYADVGWERDTPGDTEHISFHADGTFSYWCYCGSPVGDSDIVESYAYDSREKTFTLYYMEEYGFKPQTIKLLEQTDQTLTLQIRGEVCVFTRVD